MGIKKDKTRFSLILPKVVKSDLEALATKKNVSTNKLINKALYLYLEANKE